MKQQANITLLNFSCHTLSPIHLDIYAAETISLTGESGSGKSLLLRAIADLIPHQGSCLLKDVNAKQIPANQWRKQVAYFTAESQWWFDTIGEHFALPLSEQLNTFLIELGFSNEVMHWDVMRCSTGERQRLAIIRLLINQPTVLLLDEPTANLDEENTLKVEAIFKTYQHISQCSIIWVTHDNKQRDRIANRQFEIQNLELIEVSK